MTPLLWGGSAVALAAALLVLLVSVRRGEPALGRVLLALGTVGVVVGGLGWGAWISAKDVTAQLAQVRADNTCTARWMDRVEGTEHTADVDCDPASEPLTDIRVKAHTGPFTGLATAHTGLVRDLTLGWVPGIGTLLALAGVATLDRSGRRRR